MKLTFFISTLFLGVFFSIVAAGQELGQVSNVDFFQGLLAFIGGLKGAGVMAIVAGLVQLVMQLLKTPLITKFLPSLTGAKKLLIVSGLTVVGGVLALVSSGQPFITSLLHSTTLASMQVFSNQIVKQVKKVSKKA